MCSQPNFLIDTVSNPNSEGAGGISELARKMKRKEEASWEMGVEPRVPTQRNKDFVARAAIKAVGDEETRDG